MSAWVLLAAAAQAAVPTSTAVPQTSQQLFNAATTAYAGEQYQDAVRLFGELEPKIKNPRVLAVVQLRKGRSLLHLARIDEGEALIRTAFKALSNDATMQEEIFEARMELAQEGHAGLDFVSAAREGETALAIAASDMQRLRAELLLAKTTMFDMGDDSVRHAENAVAFASRTAGQDKKLLAAVHTVHARALLNHGKKDDAYTELRGAVGDQGGLDLKVTAAEIVTRSDVAIAALLTGDITNARKYMAYTGAGRTGDKPFATPSNMTVPACGGEEGLRPDDLAIVEFAVLDDGHVTGAQPVYSSRLGSSATTFARAVAQWSWRPEEVSKIPPLLRLLTRIEIHCSLAEARPGLLQPLGDRLEAWFVANRLPPFEPPAAVGPALATGRAELDRRRQAGGGLAVVPVLMRLGLNNAATGEERRAWLAEASRLLSDNGVPADIAAVPRIVAIFNGGWGRWGNDQRTALRGILAEPAVAGHPELSSTLRLMIAEPRNFSPAPSDAEALLTKVAEDNRLSAGNPLRIGALTRLASIRAASGRIAAARVAYEASGLTTQQCALADASPAMRSSGANGSDYPPEAWSWGFAGWVRTEFDIGADGRTTNQRAILAYPPFVFRDSAVKMARNFRYTQSYRPGGEAGCSGEQQTIRFLF